MLGNTGNGRKRTAPPWVSLYWWASVGVPTIVWMRGTCLLLADGSFVTCLSRGLIRIYNPIDQCLSRVSICVYRAVAYWTESGLKALIVTNLHAGHYSASERQLTIYSPSRLVGIITLFFNLLLADWHGVQAIEGLIRIEYKHIKISYWAQQHQVASIKYKIEFKG